MRAASEVFRPDCQDNYRDYLDSDSPITEPTKLGDMDLDDTQRVIVVIGYLKKDLTSRTGKKQQYDLAKKILKQESYLSLEPRVSSRY